MLTSPTPALVSCARVIAGEIERRRTAGATPIVVGLDGPSGTGKSSIARLIEQDLDVAVIQSDDFFAASISAAEWEVRSPAEKVRDCIDWKRLRTKALAPLLQGRPAEWHPFDFDAGPHPDGSYGMSSDLIRLEPGPVIIIDGAYSCRPELTDLLDLSILVDAPQDICWKRLADREEERFLEEWHQRWDAAEAYYFSEICPSSSFDLIVSNA